MAPPTELLFCPLKRSSDIDVTKPLKHLVAAHFSSSDRPKDLTDNLRQLAALRQAAVKVPHDKSDAAVKAVANYYDQLVCLEQKVPASEVQISFKWRDAFERGGLFSSRSSLTINSLAYEKAATLFNLGACNSAAAADQNLESEEGLQKALKRMQMASGIFLYLKNNVVSLIQRDPTPDLEPDTLGVLSDLMLAQAQEVVVLKALRDQMKPALIAKLCAQAESQFAAVMRNMQREGVRSVFESHWLVNVSGKQAIFNGLAHYHQAKVCNASKTIGEEIARLEYAKTLFTAGIERGPNPGFLDAKEWLRKTENDLNLAKKDNDFIYHERVPDLKSLSAINNAAVAKPVDPLPSKLSSEEQPDLFKDLCPVAIHQAQAAFDVRRQDEVVREVARLKEATNLMNTLLSSMNLPAAIEDQGDKNVPQSLLTKAESVKNAGGLNEIERMQRELPGLLARNSEMVDECERMIREEASSDAQLKERFKEKWSRTSSDALNATFKANVEKYKTIIENAKKADGVVREKMEKSRHGLELLSKGKEHLQQMKTGGGAAVNRDSGSNWVVSKLKKLMEDVETIKAERSVIESELKNVKLDLGSKFYEAYNKKGAVNEFEISSEALAKALGPLRKQVSENLLRQEHLMAEVSEMNDKFVAERKAGGNPAGGRDELFKELAAAHDAFFELKENVQEGTKFYNDLTELLATFQNKVSDFCFARKMEKEELMKDLTANMAAVKLDSAPSPPSHHSGGSESAAKKSEPPARPPQPAHNPYAGAPQAPQNPYAGAPPGAMPYPGYYPPPMPQAYGNYAMPQQPMMQQGMPSQAMPYPPYPPFGGYMPYGQQPGAPPHWPQQQ